MTLPTLFGSVAAFGIACGLIMLIFAKPMGRLERGE
jgi:hypothetical protein